MRVRSIVALCLTALALCGAQLCTDSVCEYTFTIATTLAMADGGHLTYLQVIPPTTMSL